MNGLTYIRLNAVFYLFGFGIVAVEMILVDAIYLSQLFILVSCLAYVVSTWSLQNWTIKNKQWFWQSAPLKHKLKQNVLHK